MRKVSLEDLTPITPYQWEISASFHPRMLVPAHVFATKTLLENIVGDRSLNQLVNVASLPGIVKASMVMPDVHEGYGFPIGGVAATRYPDGVISPGGIGYDINCGVRLLLSGIPFEAAEDFLEVFIQELQQLVPSGMGKGGVIRLSLEEMDEVLRYGVEWALQKGYADKEDLHHTESFGRLKDADPSCVSEKAKTRGRDQLGTIGAGNHFVEVDRVVKIFDKEKASTFGLFPEQIVILIHTGSRGLGHQVATDYIRLMQTAMAKYGYKPPDRELACVPFHSEEGRHYYKAMCAAANFAWTNRQLVSWEVRTAWENIMGEKAGPLKLMYDVAHNMAKIEEHRVEGIPMKVIVHRKGATRAFGPGSEELPQYLHPHGQPVLIPGSMGTSSYVLAGAAGSMDLSFGSCCHGAGRRLSRRKAKEAVNAPKLKRSLLEQGIFVEAGSYRGLAEEAPIAYKDVNQVVETVQGAGIAQKVAQLRPVAVLKG
jgi:tRNA-splicing ligase RtcB